MSTNIVQKCAECGGELRHTSCILDGYYYHTACLPTGKTCRHGSLARKCLVCEMQAETALQATEIADLRACLAAADELADLYEADSRLEVMLPAIDNYRAARAKVKP